MAFDDPLAMTGVDLSAAEYRRTLAAQFVHFGQDLSAQPGVLYGLGVTVSGLVSTVLPGTALLSPSPGANGSYLVSNSAGIALSITAQDSTYSRIDRVVLHLYDTEVDASGQKKCQAEIVTGTPSATPVIPALPEGTLDLVALQVGKVGQPIVVVDRRVFTSGVGAPIVAATYTALVGLGTPSRVGQLAVTADYQVLWMWNGTRWAPQGSPHFATVEARGLGIPSPAAGDMCTVGSGSSMVAYQYGDSWFSDGVEIVTNANGTAWKYPDGRMICTRRWSGTTPTASANYGSSGLTLTSISWTFPVAFVSIPVVAVGESQMTSGASWAGLTTPVTTTAVTIRLIDIAARAAGTTFVASATAIGMWK